MQISQIFCESHCLVCFPRQNTQNVQRKVIRRQRKHKILKSQWWPQTNSQILWFVRWTMEMKLAIKQLHRCVWQQCFFSWVLKELAITVAKSPRLIWMTCKQHANYGYITEPWRQIHSFSSMASFIVFHGNSTDKPILLAFLQILPGLMEFHCKWNLAPGLKLHGEETLIWEEHFQCSSHFRM